LKKVLCAAVLAAAASQPAAAEEAEGLDLSGTVRLRYEAIANQARVGFNQDDDLLNLRTTLSAQYVNGPFLAVGELWDSRVYGGNTRSPISSSEVNALELVQAYVGWKGKAGATNVSVLAGRFMLNMGSRRLVGADEYRNTTNGYTGLRVDVAKGKTFTVTGIYVLPQQRRPDALGDVRDNKVAFDHEGFDQVLWGGNLSKARAIGPVTAEASFYHFGEHDRAGRPTRDRSLDTGGLRLLRDPAAAKLDGELEGFYQWGEVSSSTAANASRVSVSAWFIHAALGYTFPGLAKARLSVQYDRASGDRAGGKFGRFDTLFGMRRADIAPSGLYNAVGRANVSSPGVRLDVAPSKRWDAFVTYHPLWLAERTDSFSTTGVRDQTGRSGSFAGHQFDSRLRYWLRAERLRFEFDGVVLTKGRFLKEAPNAPVGGTTVYGSFNLTASF
jgi:Alginate export